MGNLIRVDAELVRRNLARSRAEAADLIRAGVVFLDGVVVAKPARQMDRASALLVKKVVRDDYASRGAYKLLGALDYLGANGPTVSGVRALDAGASTGGFTDVLLRRGAAHVVAVDVGYGQILWRLREDPRVTVLERTNVRTLDPALVAPAPALVVGDLSFISLTLVLPALVRAAAADAEFLLMVKPQFEVGKEELGAGGVVRNPRLHFAAVAKVALAAKNSGLQIRAVAPSPLPGPAGNVEYFLYMCKTAQTENLPVLQNGCTTAVRIVEESELARDKTNSVDEHQLWQSSPHELAKNGKNTAQNTLGATELSEFTLLSAEESSVLLGVNITAKIAAAIIAGPATAQEKSVRLLGLPEEFTSLVKTELAQHAAYLADATKRHAKENGELSAKENV